MLQGQCAVFIAAIANCNAAFLKDTALCMYDELSGCLEFRDQVNYCVVKDKSCSYILYCAIQPIISSQFPPEAVD